MGRASARPRLALVALVMAGALAPPKAHGQDAAGADGFEPAASSVESRPTPPGGSDVLAEPSDPTPAELPDPVPREPADAVLPETSDPPPEAVDPPLDPEQAGDPEPPPPGSDLAPAEPEPAPEQPTAAPPGAAEKQPPAEKPKEDTWLDVGHAFIEQRIFAPVLRLDRFFSDERDLEAVRSRSFLRWRSEVRMDQTLDEPLFATGVFASLRFPGLNKRLERLRVVIVGETRDTIAALFPPEPGSEAERAQQREAEEAAATADAELRFRLWETLVSHGDLGAGLLFRLPPGAFGRMRLRFVLPVKKLFLTRYVATGFWRTDTHFGTSAAIEAERPLGHAVIARLGGNGTLTERSKGVEWLSELAFLVSVDAHSAAAAGVGLNGATRAISPLDRLRIYTRFRRDFYRRWLFFEVEPNVYWPLAAGTARKPVWGGALRLEVQFQGNERPAPPPAAASREPVDPP